MTKQFIEFFKKYFLQSTDIQQKKQISTIFCSFFKKYTEGNGCYQSLYNYWKNEIKPFFLNAFPVISKNGFNQNADMKFLLDLVDLDVPKVLKEDEKIIEEDKETKPDNKSNNKPENKPDNKPNNKPNLVAEIRQELDELSNYNPEKKRCNSISALKSIDYPKRITRNSYDINIVFKNDIDIKNVTKKKNVLAQCKTFVVNEKKIEIDDTYKDVEEDENINFKKKDKGKLVFIDLNLMIKEIIFRKTMINELIIYHFCQQCFSFIDKDILYKKLSNCFNYYVDKDTNFDKIKHLIDFINILTLEMFEYYNIDYNNIESFDLESPRKLYREIVKFLIDHLKENNEEEKNKINETNNKYNINRTTLINMIIDLQIQNSIIRNMKKDIKENKTEILQKKKTSIGAKDKKIKSNLDVIVENVKDENMDESKNQPNQNSTKKELPQKDDFLEKGKIVEQITSPFTESLIVDFNNKSELLIKDIKDIHYYLNNDSEFMDLNNIKSKLKFYGLINQKLKIFKLNVHESIQKKGRTYSVIEKPHFKSNSSKKGDNKGYFCVTDYNPEVISDKLYEISKKNINLIQRNELYCAAFLKKDKEKKCPNVVKCINNFNRLASFIIEDILSYDSPKGRARAYEQWVLICRECRKKKDFNDCIAIYSSLNHYIITGLQATLKEVGTKTKASFRELSKFCTYEGNYKNIREEMLDIEESGEDFIPYLGMLLRDLNYYEEKFKYILDNGCINIEKIEITNVVIDKYLSFKKGDREKEKSAKVDLDFFDKLNEISEEELEEISNNVEPNYKYEKTPEGKRLTQIDKTFFKKNKISKK